MHIATGMSKALASFGIVRALLWIGAAIAAAIVLTGEAPALDMSPAVAAVPATLHAPA